MVRRLFIFIFIVISCRISAQNADINLLEKVNGWDGRGMRNFSKVISKSETYLSLSVPVGIALYGLFSDQTEHLDKAVTISFSIIGTLALTQGFKYAIGRKRPYKKYPDKIICRDDSNSPSFPSSHTSMAFTVATALSLEYPKWYVITPAMLWATGVGIARMNQGVHYPSDVLCGAILGAGTAYLSYRINKWWRDKQEINKNSISVLQAYNMIK